MNLSMALDWTFALNRRAGRLATCSVVLLSIIAPIPQSVWAEERSTSDGATAENLPELDESELIDASGALSLDRLLVHVVARNPSVSIATHALDAASERVKQSGTLDDPMFSYMFGPQTIGSSEFNFSQKFEISQTFPWPGKRRLSVQAAEYEAESMTGELKSVREQLAYEARTAFVDRWFVERAIEINAANQKLLEEIADTAAQKYGAGAVSKQDVLQADLEREMLAHDGAVLARVKNRSTAKINTLLHRDMDALLPDSPVNLAATMQPISIEELKMIAEQSRPELKAASARIQSLDVRSELARKEFFPDFTVMAGYDSFWMERELRPSVGVSINLPIQTGRRRAAVAEAREELARAQSEQMKIRADIMLEVQEAYEDVQESQDGVALYENHLLPIAQENLEAARTGYTSGQADFMVLTSARKLLVDTQLKVNEFHASYQNAVAKLSRAIGQSTVSE